MTVTLLRDDGGGFEQVGRERPLVRDDRTWSTSFARPDGGRCQVVVTFGGSTGREPSVPVTKTFAC